VTVSEKGWLLETLTDPRSKNVAPVEVPLASLIGRTDLVDVGREGVDHPLGVWFGEDCHEIHDSLGQVRLITRNPAFRPRHAHVQEFGELRDRFG